MPLIYKIGDLCEAPEPIIVHGCNAKGVMGSGVAKAIRFKYVKAYMDYRDHYEANGLTMGEVVWSWIETPMESSNPKIVGNAITQQNYGRDGSRYVSYQAISDAFIKVREFVDASAELFSYEPYVAIPRIGAGLGGGDWSIIEDLIERSMGDYQVVVYDLD